MQICMVVEASGGGSWKGIFWCFQLLGMSNFSMLDLWLPETLWAAMHSKTQLWQLCAYLQAYATGMFSWMCVICEAFFKNWWKLEIDYEINSLNSYPSLLHTAVQHYSLDLMAYCKGYFLQNLPSLLSNNESFYKFLQVQDANIWRLKMVSWLHSASRSRNKGF